MTTFWKSTENLKQRGLTHSLALHGGVLVILALGAFWPDFSSRKPLPIVFEMVDITPAPAPAPARPRITAPEIPLERVAEMPDMALPEPAPAPTPEPAPRTEPAPTPQPPRISFDQFRNNNQGIPQAQEPRPAPSRPAPTLEIDTSRVTRQLNTLLEGSSAEALNSASPAEQAALVRYIAALEQRLRLAWQKPDLAGGPWAELRLTVQADGRLTGIRIGRQQAPAVFLESIQQAARSLGQLEPPPHGAALSTRFTFRLE